MILNNSFHDTVLGLVRNGDDHFTFRQIALLITVYGREEPYTPRELAKEMDVQPPIISMAINRLEEMRLVVRNPDPRDRRSVLISRTTEGEKLISRIARMSMKEAA